jgi:hypothetical protein
MAEDNNEVQAGQSSTATTSTFNKGMVKDFDPTFMPDGSWSHARNIVNNSNQGDLGIIGNEPANINCVTLPYTHIGSIPIIRNYWLLFSTDDINCEVGLFDDKQCQYTPISNDQAWGFKRSNIIIGACKLTANCTFQAYWVDGLNPDRTLNIGDITLGDYPDITQNQPWPGVPYICVDTLPGPCVNCEPILPLRLDVERTRLAKLISIPCVTVNKGFNGGQLPNGSYYAVVAYSVNQERVTDYFNPSQIQPLFSHNNVSSSLDVHFSNMDTENFTEFQLVIVSTVNQQTVAKQMGFYSTQTNAVSIDFINPELVSIPIEQIPLRSPAYEKSEGMYSVNSYLIRTAPTARFDFNYQPLANQIRANWVMTEQAPNYYENGGNTNGYMRDEQYAFWIRWVYNTGERSSSYHIPGRPAKDWEKQPYSTASRDNIEHAEDSTYVPKVWEVVNTAYSTDGGVNLPQDNDLLVTGNVIARGKMGYWESTESYPADKPEVWNATQHTWAGTSDSNHDLCGLPIRHHKMPADALYSNGNSYGDFSTNQNYSHVRTAPATLTSTTVQPPVAKAIRILGVEFENIKAPVDNYGNIIPGIIGYEILRSNRQGNRTIVAKGIVKNMRYYNEKHGNTSQQILYQNYLGNYLGVDHTLTDYNSLGVFDGNLNHSNTWNHNVKKNYFTFHSPDTTFNDPFLSATEMKLYGEVGSNYNTEGQFQFVPGHPKEKLITNISFIVSAIVGIGLATKALKGNERRILHGGSTFNAGVAAPGLDLVSTGQVLMTTPGLGAAENLYNELGQSVGNSLGIAATGFDLASIAYFDYRKDLNASLGTGFGGIGPSVDYDTQRADYWYTPTSLKTFGGIITFGTYWAQGTDTTLDLIRSLVPFRDYVLRSLAHMDMSYFRQGNSKVGIDNTRRWIKTSAYIDNQISAFSNYKINNLYRNKAVALEVHQDVENPSVIDNSVQTVGSVLTDTYILNQGITWKNPDLGKYLSTASAYYAGLKVRYRNQYGQIESPKQITTGCVKTFSKILDNSNIDYSNPNQPVSKVVVPVTDIIYGGDIYIGRYTEKNTFFYFYDWLYKMPFGTELDYTQKYMINYPRFFADFTKFDTTTLVSGIFDQSLTNDNASTAISAALPGGQFNLDGEYGSQHDNSFTNGFQGLRLGVRHSYMYLFQSGVIDFFVESEYNVDLRDWDDLDFQRFYDPYGYGDLYTLFDTSIIKVGNYYKYDISLGVSKVFNSYISWGATQERSYNPFTAEKCYAYYPWRTIYSLPQNDEELKDYWQVFLVNNYKDFDDKVTAFKSINKNGAIILFEHSSPLMFNGVDQLETTAGTKITVGDGGLFSQPLQTLSNADPEFQHGSCQHRLSVVNTPAGIFWVSASQGKIFTVGEGMKAVSDVGMKWWFSKYLKMFLLEQFPDFELVDNPVIGIATQTLYDNDNGILYFCKRDFRVRPEFLPYVTYAGGDSFVYNNPSGGSAKITLGNPLYFEDASWTISFDPKIQAWMSFHDWHPEYAMASIKGYLTTKTVNGKTGVWRHGNITSKFCNFYGKNFPWEIDYISQTGQAVTTTRSVEYVLESYVYDSDGIDRFQKYDVNFDEAVVYNTEQVSGKLLLVPSPANNAPLLVNYPIVTAANIQILYTKKEQKYRFNQFWDVTNNRGEFNNGIFQPVWNTEVNGYIRSLNGNNIDYNKSPFERKKFRHYLNHVVLTKNVSDTVKMLLKVSNNKLLNSPR